MIRVNHETGEKMGTTFLFHEQPSFLENLELLRGHISLFLIAFIMRESKILQLIQAAPACRNEMIERDLFHRNKWNRTDVANRTVFLDEFVSLPSPRERSIAMPLAHMLFGPIFSQDR